VIYQKDYTHKYQSVKLLCVMIWRLEEELIFKLVFFFHLRFFAFTIGIRNEREFMFNKDRRQVDFQFIRAYGKYCFTLNSTCLVLTSKEGKLSIKRSVRTIMRIVMKSYATFFCIVVL
jgi:hypothetical protein